VSPGTVSNLNKKIYEHIEKWRNKKITGEHPYVYMDGIALGSTMALGDHAQSRCPMFFLSQSFSTVSWPTFLKRRSRSFSSFFCFPGWG